MVAFLEAFRPRRVKRLTRYAPWNVCRECGWTPFVGENVHSFCGARTCVHYGGMSHLRR